MIAMKACDVSIKEHDWRGNNYVVQNPIEKMIISVIAPSWMVLKAQCRKNSNIIHNSKTELISSRPWQLEKVYTCTSQKEIVVCVSWITNKRLTRSGNFFKLVL